MSSVASATLNTEEANSQSLKRKSDDIGWEYGALIDPNNLDKVKCILCEKVVSGGIYRLKCHIAHVKGHVKACKKSTKEDQARVKQSMEHAKKAKKAREERENDVREEVTIDEEDEETVQETQGSSGASVAKKKLGPMDNFVNPIDAAAHRGKELKQQNISDAIFKERTHKCHQYIARWIYESGKCYYYFSFCKEFRILHLYDILISC